MSSSDKIKGGHIHLGKDSPYPDQYAPQLLQAIPRAQSRDAIYSSGIPFRGCDVWTAYELSWLNDKGLPQVRIAEFLFDSASPNIIESKSFKYYLNSLNQTRFSSQEVLLATLKNDLSQVSGTVVDIKMFNLDNDYVVSSIPGQCVDTLDVAIDTYEPETQLLEMEAGDTVNTVTTEQLYTNLLKTNCPVTGQPDWATIWIEYSGKKIKPQSFLKYVVSLRQHQDFHETSVEQIFYDVLTYCQPTQLSVYARYTRRGGLDINPFRTTTNQGIPFGRSSRQ